MSVVLVLSTSVTWPWLHMRCRDGGWYTGILDAAAVACCLCGTAGRRCWAAAFAYNNGWSMVNTRYYNNTVVSPLAITED